MAFKIFCTPYSRMKYNIVWNQTNFTELKHRFDGFETKGFRWNKEGEKKVLIAHGFRSSLSNFIHYAERLSDQGFQVFAFDAPAHGFSGGKTLNALEYKDFITSINEQYGPFDAYITHSYGGLAVGLNLAEIKNNQEMKTVFLAPAANSRSLCESFLNIMKVSDSGVKKYFFDTIEKLSGKNIDWFSINRCAKEIKGPVLWIHDLDDKVTPVTDAMEISKKGYKNFQFIFTRGLGHQRIYRDENVVNTVADFLM